MPYLATACDVDACKVGTSTGLAVGCSVASTVTAAVACNPLTAVFTLGTSCLAGIAIAAGISGGCALAGDAISKGKG